MEVSKNADAGQDLAANGSKASTELEYLKFIASFLTEQKKLEETIKNLTDRLEKLEQKYETVKPSDAASKDTADGSKEDEKNDKEKKDDKAPSTSKAEESEKKSRIKWMESKDRYGYGTEEEKEVPSWADKEATSISESDANDAENNYAVTWCRFQGEPLSKSQLRITSLPLRKALKDVVRGYTDVSFDTTNVSLDPPYSSVYHNKERLLKYASEKADERTAEDIKVLVSELDRQQSTELKDIATLTKQGEITFALLWSLFYPGCYVARKTPFGDIQVAVIAPSSYDRDLMDAISNDTASRAPPKLVLEFIDYKESTFVVSKVEVEIEHFKGAKKITDLAVYPLKYHESEGSIRSELIKRGRTFEAICVAKTEDRFKQYSGDALVEGDRENFSAVPDVESETTSSFSVSNRNPSMAKIKAEPGTYIMVDPEAYYQYSPSSDAGLYEEQLYDGCTCTTCCVSRRDAIGDLPKGDTTSKKGKKSKKLSDEQCLLCCPRVLGFIIREKKWAQFRVSDVQDIDQESKTKAFDSLELDFNTKKLLKQLVLQHSQNAKLIDDLVPGKGNGLIVLLHGPPGVGKTLTAESLAILSGKPLCSVTMSDVGISPVSVEQNMKRVFELATRWKALLLFDEADIFLEKRSLNDLRRNSLVSVLLRILEYYQGILFLTSNRVKTFDEAFQSRIHVAVQFKELGDRQRAKIWDMWFDKYQDDIENIGEIKSALMDGEYANSELNGRQIRNIFSSAMAMARYERKGSKMDYKNHLEVVLKRTAAFQNYMLQNKQMAEREGLR